MRTTAATLLVSVLAFLPTPASGESLVVWGSTTCQKRFLEPGAEDLKKATGIDLTVNGVGTGQGLLALIEGRAVVSAASESLADAVQSARRIAAEQGKNLTVPEGLLFHEIVQDIVIPIVHRDNPVRSLTWAQLRDINSGRIANWSQVGGPALPIRVVTSHAGSATRAFFQKLVMQGVNYAPDALTMDTTRNEILAVSDNPGGIGAVSATFLKLYSGKTMPVVTDRITRPLGLITVGPPTPMVKMVIEFFLSPEGRRNLQ
ncbi:MAG TPA: substrate-binding domain-containing protein [Candidatus Methanoperedens sp.]|nr:substrate-binding domain-containing protein [Candidatus Methanoperedens sp.]